MAPRLPAGSRLSGAVSLDPKPPAAAPGAVGARPAPGAQTVLDVTEATFAQDVLARSRQVPVVIDFWASWCGPCKQLSPVLERLAAEGGGSWVLAKIDVDANPQLAQAAAVQGIPAVKAVVGGQVVGEFTGAMPEAQVRQWLNELLEVSAQYLPPDAGPAAAGDDDGGLESVSPQHAAALDALQRNDLDGAAATYQSILDSAPADVAAKTGLARVELIRRTREIDPRAVQQTAAERPDDIPAQLSMADLELVSGHVEEAFGRLVKLVRRTAGSDRDTVRMHLLGLFDVLGAEDPRVAAARRKLATALF